MDPQAGADESVDWRDKYQKALQQLTELEREQADEQVRLRRALSRLSLAADGQDASLDRLLEQLRQQLRAGGNTDLETLLDNIDHLQKTLEDRRKEAADEVAEALVQVTSALPEQALSRSLRRELRYYADSLQQRSRKMTLLPALLQQLAELQGQAMQELTSERSGFWQRLRGKGEQPALMDTRLQPPEDLCQQAGQILQAAIQGLAVEGPLQARAQRLSADIEAGLDWDNLLPVLSGAREILLQAYLEANHAFVSYLDSVNRELADIYAALEGATQQHSGRRVAHTALQQDMAREMEQMADNLANATNLDQLKSQVQLRLESIRGALEHWRTSEQEQTGLSEQLTTLVQRLQVLEQEAKRNRLVLAQQRHRALHDPLTQLPNRQAYEERIAHEVGRWQRYGHPLTLVVCDIDNFKLINDRFGHLAGDRVLKVIGRELSRRLREVDFLARYGGEEFVLLLPETDGASAWQLLEKIRTAIADTAFHYRQQPMAITLSFGMTQFLVGDSAESAFARADQALYQAKANGRNQSRQG